MTVVAGSAPDRRTVACAAARQARRASSSMPPFETPSDRARVTTRRREPPVGYDPSQFPAFAVTVDVVILTMSEGALQMLLVRRGEAPFQGMWAIPGGFKRPTETLDEA